MWRSIAFTFIYNPMLFTHFLKIAKLMGYDGALVLNQSE
jgi:hypothetical protein